LTNDDHEAVLGSLSDLTRGLTVDKFEGELPKEHDVDLEALEANQHALIYELGDHVTSTKQKI
jgi:hypothetical protein